MRPWSANRARCSHYTLFCFVSLVINIRLPCISSEPLLLLNEQLSTLSQHTPARDTGVTKEVEAAQAQGLLALKNHLLTIITVGNKFRRISRKTIVALKMKALLQSADVIKQDIITKVITPEQVRDYYIYLLQNPKQWEQYVLLKAFQSLYRKAFDLDKEPRKAANTLIKAIKIIEGLPAETSAYDAQRALEGAQISLSDLRYYIDVLSLFDQNLWQCILTEIDTSQELLKLFKIKKPEGNAIYKPHIWAFTHYLIWA